jgi:protein-tyrosine kinase
MSRIDRAIQIREGTKLPGAAEPHDGHAAGAASLQQYDREQRLPAVKEFRSPQPAPPVVDPAEPIGPVARRRPRPDDPSRPGRLRRPKFAIDGDRQARLVTATSSAVSVEQYRKVAATLHEEQVRSQLKTVMVTSALPGEGKTLTVVNLALTLSESYGRRVLVIDADLRGPSLHAALNIPNDSGLSEALNGGELTFVEVSSELAVLPAGNPGPTPLAALTSDRMAQILEECASRFDWVLIDTPPIGVLPDAQVLVRLAGAVIFVIGAGTTPAATVERAIAELGGPDAIFGVLLNRVDERRIPSASYYGHYASSSSNKKSDSSEK